MMAWRPLMLLLGARPWLGVAGGRAAGRRAQGFRRCVHRDADGRQAKYVLFVPHGYQDDRAYPLILFLHGRGESGTDGNKQVTVGLGPAVKRQARTFPFFVLFPQSQQASWQTGSADARTALDILAEVEKQYPIDARRVYLTGVSMGGFGTWGLAQAHPDRWAAIVPVCGGGDARLAHAIRHVPCWCFHGGTDPIVQAKHSRDMIAALEAAGGHPTYFEYPQVGHNCWDEAYATAELYRWLLKQRLS